MTDRSYRRDEDRNYRRDEDRSYRRDRSGSPRSSKMTDRNRSYRDKY